MGASKGERRADAGYFFRLLRQVPVHTFHILREPVGIVRPLFVFSEVGHFSSAACFLDLIAFKHQNGFGSHRRTTGIAYDLPRIG